ncbi:MAG: heme-binding domain-containing protein [Bacteroidia bacterium]|nr:heme-binding domain-containing protein [Bacteroidia bacterium]
MKKAILIFGAAAILIIVTGFIIDSAAGAGQDSLKSANGLLIPADLQNVITKSCMPCHSNDGKKMAKAMVNFSNWNTSKPGTLVKKGKAICKMISKDAMPPAQFKEANPELALTPAQKEAICKWTNSMKPEKN